MSFMQVENDYHHVAFTEIEPAKEIITMRLVVEKVCLTYFANLCNLKRRNVAQLKKEWKQLISS